MEDFNSAYAGTPPWDIGRPQREFVRLAQTGEIRGIVLDVGCGTGENTLYLASLGHKVWGVDRSPTAVEKAKAKARRRDVKVTFLVADALALQRLGRRFDTVIDSGLFHVFSDAERPLFVRSLATVLKEGSTYYMMCFSEHEPGGYGPRRVAQHEIRTTFHEGWKVNYIREARFESNLHSNGARAWLASITKS